jgi:light-regulated signal transduction histidine kinase (bacteriophytochrome)
MGTPYDEGSRDAALAALRSLPASWVVVLDPERRVLTESGRPPDAEARTELDPLWRAALTGQSGSIDLTSTGSQRAYRVDVGPWRDGDGAIVGAIALGRELGEPQAAELQARGSELEAFSYSVSHDLRAPLRAIDGFSAALSRRNADQLDDSGRELLERIRKAVSRMGALIDAMLVLSRLSRRELCHAPVDLSALAHEVVEELRAGDPDRDVEIVVEDGLSATGDRELLRLVLENLIENAWKFTAGRADARIELLADSPNGRPSFVVRDNGVGFDMSQAERLFVPFQRLHADEEFGGVGIGLATVQRVVRRHGGTIRGVGVVGEGASFHFDLDPASGAAG